jgi:hypothetical protein
MSWIDFIGFAAFAMVLATFCMTRMLPLRIFAPQVLKHLIAPEGEFTPKPGPMLIVRGDTREFTVRM